MTLAVTLKAIDAALLSRYSGISIRVDNVLTPVTTFMEKPSVEEYQKREYPSIAMGFMGLVPNFDLSESTDEDQEQIGSLDMDVVPPTMALRDNPLPYIVKYHLDTWHKVMVSESRDLVSEVMTYKTPPRGYLPVTNVDSGTTNVDVFWSGTVVPLDESRPDMIIYHKSLMIDVHAYLITVDPEYIVDSKVVTDMYLHLYSRKTKKDNTGRDIEIISGEDAEHAEIHYTDSEEEKV